MSDLVCLTLHAPRTLSDRLSDFLLEHESMTTEFSTVDVRFHGTELRERTISEQIQGHARQIQVSVILAPAAVEALLAEIGQAFPGCGVSYWIGPVAKTGSIP